jgi:hypothetical protein
VRLTILPPSVSRLSRESVGASTSHNPRKLGNRKAKEEARNNLKLVKMDGSVDVTVSYYM